MITLDGSHGEGGGQILRSALALSLVTGRPFRIHHIRARRPKPGLMRQHLACVEAAARIGSAVVEGAVLGATELTFQPGVIAPGNYEFKIGSAGSTMLLLQTILPPLMLANQPSEVTLEGGTHNPFAPPFPFIAGAFLPLLRRIGFQVEASLERHGFYPNGGGRCRISIQPASALGALMVVVSSVPDDVRLGETTLPEDTQMESPDVAAYDRSVPDDVRLGETTLQGASAWSAEICLAGLPRSIAERELAVVQERLGLSPERCHVNECAGAFGPGNSIHIHAPLDGYAEVFSAFGAPRLRADQVAAEAVGEAQDFLQSGAVVGRHLADQLLLPLALAKGGSFVTLDPTDHTRTNLEVIQHFLEARITVEPVDRNLWRIHVESQNHESKRSDPSWRAAR